jgi:hypothetical protein
MRIQKACGTIPDVALIFRLENLIRALIEIADNSVGPGGFEGTVAATVFANVAHEFFAVSDIVNDATLGLLVYNFVFFSA